MVASLGRVRLGIPVRCLLVAQAMVESLPILTADPQLARYAVETIAAT